MHDAIKQYLFHKCPYWFINAINWWSKSSWRVGLSVWTWVQIRNSKVPKEIAVSTFISILETGLWYFFLTKFWTKILWNWFRWRQDRQSYYVINKKHMKQNINHCNCIFYICTRSQGNEVLWTCLNFYYSYNKISPYKKKWEISEGMSSKSNDFQIIKTEVER